MAKVYQLKVNQHSEEAVIAASANLSVVATDEVALWVGTSVEAYRHNEKITTLKYCADALREAGVPTPIAGNVQVGVDALNGVKSAAVESVLAATGTPTGGEGVVAVVYGATALLVAGSEALAVVVNNLLDAYKAENVAV